MLTLSNLKIKNFACFDRLELDLSSGLNIIVAPGGCGKTQLFRAIIWCLYEQDIFLPYHINLPLCFCEIKDEVSNEMEMSVSLKVHNDNGIYTIQRSQLFSSQFGSILYPEREVIRDSDGCRLDYEQIVNELNLCGFPSYFCFGSDDYFSVQNKIIDFLDVKRMSSISNLIDDYYQDTISIDKDKQVNLFKHRKRKIGSILDQYNNSPIMRKYPQILEIQSMVDSLRSEEELIMIKTKVCELIQYIRDDINANLIPKINERIAKFGKHLPFQLRLNDDFSLVRLDQCGLMCSSTLGESNSIDYVVTLSIIDYLEIDSPLFIDSFFLDQPEGRYSAISDLLLEEFNSHQCIIATYPCDFSLFRNIFSELTDSIFLFKSDRDYRIKVRKGLQGQI